MIVRIRSINKQSIPSRISSTIRSRFLRDSLTLSLGTLASQLIAFAFLPLLSRAYDPSDFGVLQLYVSLMGFLVVFGTFQFESLIVLPESDTRAAQLVRFVAYTAGITALGVLCVFLLFRIPIANAIGSVDISIWLLLLPISVFFGAQSKTLRYFAIRFRLFATLAMGSVTKNTSNACLALLIKLFFTLPVGGGLVIASILAELVNYAYLRIRLRNSQELRANYSVRDLLATAKSYSATAITLTFSQGVGTLNTIFPSIIIGTHFGTEALGLFSMAERVALVPAQLVSSAIGDVYRQRAATQYREQGHFDGLLVKTVLLTIGLSVIPYSLAFLFTKPMFGRIFGAEWHEAGGITLILLVGSLVAFVVNPVDKGAVIVGANRYIVLWHIVRLFCKSALYLAIPLLSLSLPTVLWLLVGIRCSMYGIDVLVEYMLARGRT